MLAYDKRTLTTSNRIKLLFTMQHHEYLEEKEEEEEEAIFYESEAVDVVDGGNDQLIAAMMEAKYRRKLSGALPNRMRKQIAKSAGNYSDQSDGDGVPATPKLSVDSQNSAAVFTVSSNGSAVRPVGRFRAESETHMRALGSPAVSLRQLYELGKQGDIAGVDGCSLGIPMHECASAPALGKQKVKKRIWWFQKVGIASEKAANMAADMHERLPDILDQTTATLQAVRYAAMDYGSLIGCSGEEFDTDPTMTVVEALDAFYNASDACQKFFADPKLTDSMTRIRDFTATLKDFDIRKCTESLTNAATGINKLVKSIQDDISPLFRVLFFVGIPLILIIVSCLGIGVIPSAAGRSTLTSFALYVAELALACCGIGCAFALILSMVSFLMMLIRMYTDVS